MGGTLPRRTVGNGIGEVPRQADRPRRETVNRDAGDARGRGPKGQRPAHPCGDPNNHRTQKGPLLRASSGPLNARSRAIQP